MLCCAAQVRAAGRYAGVDTVSGEVLLPNANHSIQPLLIIRHLLSCTPSHWHSCKLTAVVAVIAAPAT
jgi:hypothetical protein